MAYEREAGMLRAFGRLHRGVRWVLSQMDAEDRLIMEKMYIVRQNGNLEAVCQELGIEKSAVYKRRGKALARFAALWNAWEVESQVEN